MVEYSFSFNLGGPRTDQASPAQDDLWIVEPFAYYALSGDQYLVRNKRTQKLAAVQPEVLDALGRCDSIRTLNEHAEAVVRQSPALQGYQGDIARALRAVADMGILRSVADIAQGLQVDEAVGGPEGSASIYIRTADRPRLMRRLLDSLAANEARFGGGYQYIVMDDSAVRANGDENRAAVAAVAEKGGINALYYGYDAQERFIRRLKAAHPEHADPIAWLLEPDEARGDAPSYGRMWNHALLMSAGRRALLMDDDALCTPGSPPGGQQAQVEISGRSEEIRFYEDRPALEAEVQPLAIDPISEHLSRLGRRLGELVEPASDALAHVRPEDLQDLGGSSRVLVTTNGVHGDPGLGSTTSVFVVGGTVGGAAISSLADYKERLKERTAWRGKSCVHVRTSLGLMTTTLTGLDNRVLLPPALPMYSGEDELFGCTLKYIYPDYVEYQMPWSLAHFPEPSREWDWTDVGRPSRPAITHLLGRLAEEHRTSATAESGEDRLATLGALYRDIGRSAPERLAGVVTDIALADRSRLVSSLNASLADGTDMSDEWRADLQRIIQANTSRDSLESLGANSASLGLLQSVAQRYGQALDAWPSLWSYCADQGSALLDEVLGDVPPPQRKAT